MPIAKIPQLAFMNTSTLPEGKRRLLSRPWLIPVLILVLVAAVVAGWHWWKIDRFIQSTDDAYVRADVVTVSPHVPGYVATVPVDDNQAVHRNDVLVTLDDRDYRARVDDAAAAVSAAAATSRAEQAATATLAAQIGQQASVIAQARANVSAAQADVSQRNADARRYGTLHAQDATSAQRWEQARADARKARAELARTLAAIDAQTGEQDVLRKRLVQANATVEQARDRLVAARARLALARLDLEHTVVRAPRDGVVGQRSVRPGQYVETGMPMLAVVPVQAAYVVANFKETQVGRMHVGQTAELTVDAYPDQTLHGRVLGLAPGSGAEFALLPPDNATGNFTKIVQRVPVKIGFDAPPQGIVLRPGTSVVVHVNTLAAKGNHS